MVELLAHPKHAQETPGIRQCHIFRTRNTWVSASRQRRVSDRGSSSCSGECLEFLVAASGAQQLDHFDCLRMWMDHALHKKLTPLRRRSGRCVGWPPRESYCLSGCARFTIGALLAGAAAGPSGGMLSKSRAGKMPNAKCHEHYTTWPFPGSIEAWHKTRDRARQVNPFWPSSVPQPAMRRRIDQVMSCLRIGNTPTAVNCLRCLAIHAMIVPPEVP